jgi:hypothetical protein
MIEVGAVTSLSRHLPQVAGAEVTVPATGVLVVDTELRSLRSITATLSAAAIVANEESLIAIEKNPVEPGCSQKVTVRVYKGGTGHGTLADTATKVFLLALGD